MLSERQVEFTKENIDIYLREVAKEYRRLIGKSMHAELILIGGASILINYGFRGMTTDIDAIIQAASGMKDAINIVRDRYNLPTGWLNADFKKTDSYTPKLSQYSVYYKTYFNVLTIRTISAEYLIAMKLRSGRQYKNDYSDILGILAEHEKAGNAITKSRIRKAVKNLYGEWETLPESSRIFIENVMRTGQFEMMYEEIIANEKQAKQILISFENDYPGVTNKDNVNRILENLRLRKKKAEK